MIRNEVLINDDSILPLFPPLWVHTMYFSLKGYSRFSIVWIYIKCKENILFTNFKVNNNNFLIACQLPFERTLII